MDKQLDLGYSERETDARRIDVFLPAIERNKACIFFIHGGGWAGGSRRQWHAVMEHFCRLGYVCTSVGYRLMPGHRFPAPFEDVRLAMGWTKGKSQEFGFDPSRIAVWGSSAGGHLAALLATIGPEGNLGVSDELCAVDTRPSAAVCLCTVFSVHERGGYYKPEFLGATEAENPGIYREASPIDHVKGGEPPFLMVVGDADKTTPTVWHEAMRDRLVAAGGSAEMVILPGAGHGYGYGVSTDHQKRTLEVAERFLARNLTGSVKGIGSCPQ